MSTAVNEELAAEHEGAILATLGPPARMIGFSKGGYVDAYPGHAAVFNTNVCLGADKVWWGDLDVTVDEHLLVELAARTGAIVSLLYESDGRFRNEDSPLLDRAVYSVTPSGYSQLDHLRFKRHAQLTRGPVRVEHRAAFVVFAVYACSKLWSSMISCVTSPGRFGLTLFSNHWACCSRLSQISATVNPVPAAS